MGIMSPWCVISGGHEFKQIGTKVVCTYCGKVAK